MAGELKKLCLGFLIFTLSLEWLMRSKYPLDHPAWWEEVPGFFAGFGLIGAVLLIFLSKVFSKYILGRVNDKLD